VSINIYIADVSIISRINVILRLYFLIHKYRCKNEYNWHVSTKIESIFQRIFYITVYVKRYIDHSFANFLLKS